MFGRRVTEEYRQRICQDSFGENYNFDQLYLNVEYLNILYGGQNPKVSYAIYTNGYLDPWLYQGITHTYDENAYAVNVPGYSRWADATSLNTLDSIVLYNAKYTVVDTFR
ncbi:putative serine protease K12H4.7, partial [Pseudolycoriella hygida]